MLIFRWFAGKIPRALAEKLVMNPGLPRGSYLIRERETEQGKTSLFVFFRWGFFRFFSGVGRYFPFCRLFCTLFTSSEVYDFMVNIINQLWVYFYCTSSFFPLGLPLSVCLGSCMSCFLRLQAVEQV